MIADTIAAIATPPGSGGIGIIRISGPEALSVLVGVFGRGRKGPDGHGMFESHQLTHGYIFDGDTGAVIDEVMVVFMASPKSYTAEDVVEIQAHSGPLVMRTILDQVLSKGIRLADPGEFTKRAFINGRIDLTQAEAVADIINARSAQSLKIASSQNTGHLSEVVDQARQKLIGLLTLLESAIDFPDETSELIPNDQGLVVIEQVLDTCQRSIQQYEDAHFIRDGIKLAICGSPNVGKSSLMNRLLDRERSIVTSVPGTTRDLIEESLNIKGVPFIISDTAGMHPTDDLVERIGIERAKEHIRASDLILFLKEPGTRLSHKEISAIVPLGKKFILVINKIDLVDDYPAPPLPEEYENIPWIGISALDNQGIDQLKKMISEMVVSDVTSRSTVVPNLRHKTALEKAWVSLESAQYGLLNNREEEMLAIDVREAADYLGEITGDTAGIDILDSIFDNFCIGK